MRYHGVNVLKNLRCWTSIRYNTSSVQQYNNMSTTTKHESKIKGCIFDMDGTLTQPHLLNIPVIKQKFNLTREDDLIDAMNEDDELNKYVVHCEVNAYNNCELNDGYYELMHYIDNNNIHKAIVTRSTQLGVDAFVEYTGKKFEQVKLTHTHLTKHLPYSHTLTREFEHEGKRVYKPEPRPLLHIAEQWDLQPNAILMVGDSSDDIEAGNKAGMKTVLIRHDHNQWLEEKADYVIDTLDQLIDIIQNAK